MAESGLRFLNIIWSSMNNAVGPGFHWVNVNSSDNNSDVCQHETIAQTEADGHIISRNVAFTVLGKFTEIVRYSKIEMCLNHSF